MIGSATVAKEILE